MTCPSPSRCPYCVADARRHWIGWGNYERYAGDLVDVSRRVAVPRYRCKVTRRTFSLLPDELLPYCSLRTALVVACLYGLFVEKTPLTTLAGRLAVPRGTLRHLKARFVRVVFLLRLSQQEGALSASAFLRTLLGDGGSSRPPEESAARTYELFRSWKEREPKHSLVGIYAR